MTNSNIQELSLQELESLQGGKLTTQEIDDFVGSASCVLTLASGIFTFAGAVGIVSCARWLSTF